MKCEDFEMLMADALGDELSDADRPAFEAHLTKCETCRREYETARQAVVAMRKLPGPAQVTVRRKGDSLVIDEGPSRRRRRPSWFAGGVLRYAASILIAFTAGYALHAGLMISNTGQRVVEVHPSVADDEDTRPATNLQGALVSVHARNPARSDLAKCLIAMAKPRG